MSKFFGLFKGKKSSNKENELPHEESHFARGSLRVSKRQDRERAARFLEQGLPNVYSVPKGPKTHKSVASCPGGIRDESYDHDDMNRYYLERRHERTEKHDARHRSHGVYDDDYDYDGTVHYYMTRRHEQGQGLKNETRPRRGNRDTSEYGSGDPSPIGNTSRRTHYTPELGEDSDPDDYEYSINIKQIAEDQRDQIQQMEKALSKCKSRLKHAEERHFHYKDQCRVLSKQCQDLRQAKEQTELAFVERSQHLVRENANLKQKLKMLEQQLRDQQMMSAYQYPAPPTFGTTPQFGGFSMSGGPNSHRLSMMHTPAGMNSITGLGHIQSSSTTPLTVSGEGGGGAGEALTEPSDVSYSVRDPQNESSFDSKGSRYDEDEVKEFNAGNSDDFMSMELARSSMSTASLHRGMSHNGTLQLTEIECASSSTMVASPTGSNSNTLTTHTNTRPKLQRSVSMRS